MSQSWGLEITNFLQTKMLRILRKTDITTWVLNSYLLICFLDVSGDCKKKTFQIPKLFISNVFFFFFSEPTILKTLQINTISVIMSSIVVDSAIVSSTFDIISVHHFLNFKNQVWNKFENTKKVSTWKCKKHYDVIFQKSFWY